MGGETEGIRVSADTKEGPSPRGRGNPVEGVELLRLRGSIPAWAGKPEDILGIGAALSVHPRVGGETSTA